MTIDAVMHERTITSGTFGGIQRGVGPLDQALHALVRFDRGQSAADGDSDWLSAAIHDDPRDCFAYFLCGLYSLLKGSRRHQNGNPPAAITCHRVLTPDRSAECPTNRG